MKNIITLSLLLVFAASLLRAQVVQKYIGKSGISALALRSVQLKSSTNRVIVGAKRNSGGNEDAFITCIDAADNVLWTKEISTAQEDRFISVIATSDGGCVAVGYVNQLIGSAFYDHQASVYKFSAAGTVLWSKIFKATSYGEIFYSVIELPGSNDIICAGLYEYGIPGRGNASIMVNLTSAGTVNWAKRYYMSTGNQIMDIVYHNGKVVCLGFYRGVSYYDGQLFAIKPNDGSVLWNRGYEYNSAFSSTCNTQWFDRIQVVNDTFYISAFISDSWGPAPWTPTLLRLDSLGQNPLCLEFPITGFSYANVVHAKVVSSKEIYLFQHPNSANWFVLNSISPISAMTDVTITKIRDMANPLSSMVFSRKFNTTGEQAIVDADINGGKIRGWGAAKNDPTVLKGSSDIFKFEADTSMAITPTNCIADVTGQVFGSPSVTLNSLSFSSITDIVFSTPANPIVSTVIYDTANPCPAAPIPINIIVPNFRFSRASCFGFDFTDLTTTTNSGIKFWQWNFGDGGTSILKNPSHTYASPGSYSVKLLVTDSNGKKDSISKLLNFVINRFAQAGNDTLICSQVGGTSLPLLASGGVRYSWSPSTGLSDPAIANPIATISNTSTYVVTITDANGCIDKDTINISLKSGMADVIASPKNITGCFGSTAQLNATGTKYYLWQPSSGLNSDTISNPKLMITGNKTFVVIGTDTNGCVDKDTVTISSVALPNIKVSSDNNIVDCSEKAVVLTATGALSYEWTPEIFCETPNAPSTKVRPQAKTVFTVKGKNSNGCEAKDTITVFYEGKTNVKVPNAFTPNDDGINDKIKPIIVCDFIMNEFSIYNRWGNKVFTSNEVNQGWDGKSLDGKPCELGVYYYLIKGKNSKNEDVLLKGDITLMR
jgi:gliding motility-associated-like protein